MYTRLHDTVLELELRYVQYINNECLENLGSPWQFFAGTIISFSCELGYQNHF